MSLRPSYSAYPVPRKQFYGSDLEKKNFLLHSMLLALEIQEVINPALVNCTIMGLDFWDRLCQDWGSKEDCNLLATFFQEEFMLQLLLQACDCNVCFGF